MRRTLLRWSWRDLRARWVQVVAIALIIAVGAGSFAGFNGMTRWRERSNAASFELTCVHDLRARLGVGAFVPAGTLAQAASGIPLGDQIAALEERLVVPPQVDASDGGGQVLVRGRLIGVDLRDGGPYAGRAHAERGRLLTETDAGRDVAVLEFDFARHYALPAAGSVRLTGGRALEYVGHVTQPEHFIVVTDEREFLAQSKLAVVFTSLEAAGRLADLPGAVNDLVGRGSAGADRAAVQAELAEALGARVQTIGDDPSYNTIVRDVEGDQQTTTVLRFAILLGAVFAVFNLTARMVESQRREIGIAMALGVPPLRLIGLGIRALLREMLLTPVTETPFQFDLYVRAAALGIGAPLAAISYPVWRAVRVAPIDAIRTGHLAARGWGLSPLARRLPLPGGSLGRMPLRTVLRAPRRTLLTVLGIGAAIAVLVGVMGALDAFLGAADRSERALTADHPERLIVELDTAYLLDSPVFAAIAGFPSLTRPEPATRLRASLVGAGVEFGVFLEFVDFESALWYPALRDGKRPDPRVPGVVLAEKAGRDLGVEPGGLVLVRLARRDGTGFRVVETELRLVGFHDGAFRTFAYADRRHLEIARLAGTANQLSRSPRPAPPRPT